MKKVTMSDDQLKDFREKYCSTCGTQICPGIEDEEFREGCEYYIREILHEPTIFDIIKEINNSSSITNPSMTQEKAIDLLLCYVHCQSEDCSSLNLTCHTCPIYLNHKSDAFHNHCQDWNDEDVKEAIKFLLQNRKN